MAILEDDIKRAMKCWLEQQGFTDVVIRLGTRQGYDIEARNLQNNRLLVIECKGEAKNGSQHKRSWDNVASALLTTLNEQEKLARKNDVGMAFPDTDEYRNRMVFLQDFCFREEISVFWVDAEGHVRKWE